MVLSLTIRARVLLQEGPSRITSSEPLTEAAVFVVTAQEVIVMTVAEPEM